MTSKPEMIFFFFKVLLPREVLSIASETSKIQFANTKDFSVVTFWKRHVCFGYFGILDLCRSISRFIGGNKRCVCVCFKD